MRPLTFLASIAFVLTPSALPAAAQGPLPVTVLHPDGTATDAHLAGLSDGALRVFDADRRLTTLTPDAVAVLTPHAAPTPALPGAPGAPDPPGVLRLTDGQRLAGAWTGLADGGESLRWTHPAFGTVAVPLDRVAGWTAAFGTPGPEPESESGLGDVVVLTSGERLTGFLYLPDDAGAVASGDVLMLAPADDPAGLAVPVPAASVASVTLANPPATRDPSADPDAAPNFNSAPAPARVTLRDGSRLRARALILGAGDAAFDAEVAGHPLRIAVPADAVRRVVFTAGGRDAHDLTDLAAQAPPPAAADAALWGPGVAGARAVPGGHRLAAPARLGVALPPGATFVVGRAVLDLPPGIPADRARWAGCTLRIGGAPAVELVLDAAHPEAPFRVAVSADATELVFTLDPGPHGPVLDVVRIEDALVLTGPH